MSTIISLNVDADGIAELRWDDPGSKVNVFSAAAIAEFGNHVTEITSSKRITGVLITSGKKTFHAGADLNMVSGFFDASAEALWSIMTDVMQSFYALETCGKPVAAVINGHALGGGFEMALAAHARFAANDPAIKLGLPEAAIGLMPGFGGTQRMARIAPYQKVAKDILAGTTFDPKTAQSLGLLTDVIPAEHVCQAARGWIAANRNAEQPWMARGYSATDDAQTFERFFHRLNAGLTRDGADAKPQDKLIAEALYHGLQMPIEPALRLEIRRFIELTRNPAAYQALQQSFFALRA